LVSESGVDRPRKGAGAGRRRRRNRLHLGDHLSLLKFGDHLPSREWSSRSKRRLGRAAKSPACPRETIVALGSRAIGKRSAGDHDDEGNCAVARHSTNTVLRTVLGAKET
jgi:hypothetical protein